MGQYSDMWKGSMLFYQIQQTVTMLLCFNFLWMKVWDAIVVMLLFTAFFQLYLTKRNAGLKEKHEGKRFLAGRHLREKEFSEDVVLGFRDRIELKIHEGLPKGFKKIEETSYYKNAKHIVLRKQAVDNIAYEEESETIASLQIEKSEEDPEEKTQKKAAAISSKKTTSKVKPKTIPKKSTEKPKQLETTTMEPESDVKNNTTSKKSTNSE